MVYPNPFTLSSPHCDPVTLCHCGTVNLPFTLSPPLTLHLDINSCFATLEQQANPLLRGRPVAVAASTSHFGCILASSIEAKRLGIKTGMRVGEGKNLYPPLVVLSPDPNKYRHIHHLLHALLSKYSPTVIPKSIDEFIVMLHPSSVGATRHGGAPVNSPVNLAQEIKHRIKQEIGDHITVSIGIAPNRLLAKLGADIDKPDGLQIIDHRNYLNIYAKIELTDFCGISTRLKLRLNQGGIVTPLDFYHSSLQTLRGILGKAGGHDWYYRLRGYEVDNWETTRRVFGNSYVLPTPLSKEKALAILSKLVDKSTRRLRAATYTTSIINLYIRYDDKTSFHQSLNLLSPHFDTRSIYAAFLQIYDQAPPIRVKQLAVSCSGLTPLTPMLTLFGTTEKSQALMTALDTVNSRYGDFTLRFGTTSKDPLHVHDAIAFGK